MHPITLLLIDILSIYKIILIIWIIIGWLTYFNILNRHQPFIMKLSYILERLTEPALKPIRRVIPPVAGLDLSPIILFLLITFIQRMLAYYG